ncbi:MAG TPA: AMP-binding protein [Acidobacteriaceae bacterium]|nr:AMP-binding protein [Acidobacteriaceae bacterium]
MNIAEAFAEVAAERPAAPAIIDVRGGRDRVLTFRELDEAAARVAAQILALGVAPGDGILVLHRMSLELYAFLTGVFRAGAVAVFLDPSAGRQHIARCCDLFPIRAFFGSPKAHLLRLALAPLRRVPLALCPGFFPGAVRVSISDSGARAEIASLSESAPALVTFTSGSTGEPKAAARSHGFLLAQHRAIASAIGLRAGVVDLTTLPIFVLANLASGVTSVLPDCDLRRPGAVDAAPVLAQIERHAIQTVGASPALIARLVEKCARAGHGIPCVQHVFMGGAPVFPRDLRDARTAFPNAEVTAVYGSTEAEPMAEVDYSAISPDDFLAMERGDGLLSGSPVTSVSLRILRDGWGRPIAPLTEAEFRALWAAPGEVGEIAVSGAHVLPGYLNGVGDSETKFDVGGTRWHRTGDLGRLDSRGRLWLLGRASAKIEDDRGILYPFAVECAAQQIPGVRRAAVLRLGDHRILAVELVSPATAARILEALPNARLDEVRVLFSIPLDKRHNAKIDYVTLRRLLSGGEQPREPARWWRRTIGRG